MSLNTGKTLFFEEIALGTSLINKDTIPNWPGGHSNSWGPYYKVTQQAGTYTQTEGNVFGDNYPSTPACPYHMPRNLNRFNEPRLTVKKKNPGDVIQAKDLNTLIDKIKLFQYVWEAEANNIYGYQAVSGSSRVSVDISNLNSIKNDDAAFPSFSINDPVISGNKEVKLYKTPNYYSVIGDNKADVISKLTDALTTKLVTGVEWNNPIPHGFPEDLSLFGYSLTSGKQIHQYTDIIHAGFTSLVGAKYIQDTTTPKRYTIKYISGNKKGEIIKDKDGYPLYFYYENPYVISYRPNNQPDTPEKYYGFILYFSSTFSNDSSQNQSVTSTTYIDPIKSISLKQAVIPNAAITNADTTPALNIDIRASLQNAPATSLIWESVDSKVNFMAWLNTLPDTQINLPRQRVYGNTYQYEKAPNVWENIDGIYSINMITPFMKTYTKNVTSGTPPVTTTQTIKVYGFMLETYKNMPNETTTKINIDGLDNNTFLDKPDGSIVFNTDFFDTPDKLMNLLTSKTQFQDLGSGVDFILMHESNLVGTYNEALTRDEFYNDAGQITSQSKYKYFLGLSCPDGSTLDGGLCKVTNTQLIPIVPNVVSEDFSSITVLEQDITYIKALEQTGTEKYPIIKATDYTKMRLTLNRYLDNILALAMTGINTGTPDTVTANLIQTFKTNQSAQTNVLDKDNPDTNFLGYQAQADVVIKVDFYNILVDAYKLIVNSCLCNADCACNVNCICNVNCGCNYSG